MKFILSICLVFSIVSCFASTPSLTSQKIKGYLVDYRTKSELDEVQVELVSLGTGKRFKTETKNGVFIFRHVPIGKQILLLVDKDYVRDTLKIFETNRKDHLQLYGFSKTQPFNARLKVTWFFNWGDRTFTRKNGTKYTIEHYWSHLLAKIILIVYGLCLIMIFYYSVVQLTLAFNYRKSKKKGTAPSPSFDVQNAPKVTVQLPM